MKTPVSSVVCFLAASALGALGQYLYKSGSDAQRLVNARILGGVACYIAVMVLFVAAFKRGGSMSVLYPIYATTFIWAALIARVAYQTPIRPVHVAGMALLILGMMLMGRS